MIEPNSTTTNASAERVVFRRFWVLFALLVPSVMGSGTVAILASRGLGVSTWGLILAVELLVGVALGVGAGYGEARTTVVAFVPKTITFQIGGLIGNFPRERWQGPPVSTMRFERVTVVRRTPFLRLPTVDAKPPADRWNNLSEAQRFFLSEDNFARVQDAWAAWKSSQNG